MHNHKAWSDNQVFESVFYTFLVPKRIPPLMSNTIRSLEYLPLDMGNQSVNSGNRPHDMGNQSVTLESVLMAWATNPQARKPSPWHGQPIRNAGKLPHGMGDQSVSPESVPMAWAANPQSWKRSRLGFSPQTNEGGKKPAYLLFLSAFQSFYRNGSFCKLSSVT